MSLFLVPRLNKKTCFFFTSTNVSSKSVSFIEQVRCHEDSYCSTSPTMNRATLGNASLSVWGVLRYDMIIRQDKIQTLSNGFGEWGPRGTLWLVSVKAVVWDDHAHVKKPTFRSMSQKKKRKKIWKKQNQKSLKEKSESFLCSSHLACT